MKKILSLFALLLTIVIGAKAASVNDLVPISSDWTFIADDITSNGTTKTTANTLYCDGKIISTTGNSVATNKGNSTIGGASHLNSLRIKNTQDQLTFKVAGACTVKFYTQSHSSRGIQAGSTAGGTDYGTQDVSTTTWELELDDAATVYLSSFGGDFYIAGFEVTMAAQKTVTAVSLDGVKIDGTLATENTDYTISGTTITLSQSYAVAPEVALVQKITYDDNSTKTSDIDVTLTKGEAYFTGTATIGADTDYETEYTVQVPVSTAATLEASVASATVTSPKVATGTAKFNVIGANLTGTTVDLAFASAVDGLTVSPASIEVTEGAVNQEVTVSYYSLEDVSETIANLTITSTGVDAITIPVTYSSTAGIADLTPISDSYTWDWSTAASAGIASPDQNEMVVFANMDGWNASFDAEAIAGKVKDMYASKSAYKYCQGGTLKFNTIYPGTVSIDFSNTGSKSEYRWLAVNGAVTEYKSKDETKVTTAEIAVPAGDVIIEAIMGTSAETAPEYTAANTMLNFRKVVFTADNGKEDSDLTVAAEASVNIGETEDVVYTTSSTGAVSVESSAPAIATATVDQENKTITITGVAAGQATITVSQEADDSYNAGSQEITVTVINPNIKYVYDATGLTDDEFILTAHNFGGEYGMNPDNEFATTSTGDWTGDKEYGDYSGKFYNMSKAERYITFKVKGAENFRLGVQNGTAGRTYTVKVGEAPAQEITHVGGGVKFTDIFETGTTDEVTIVIAGGGSNANSVYPVAIQFNVQTSENIAFSDVTTYVTKHALDFSEVTELSAYAVTQIKTTSVATEKVGQVPAGTPLLIKADGAVNVDVPVIESAEAITNLLIASNGEVTADGSTIFAYSKSKSKFTKVAEGLVIPADKAYLQITTPNAPTALDVDFDGATAVETIAEANEANSAAPVKVIKNGKLYIGNYNVAGQQVK